MKSKVHVAIIFHFHQPVDNFGWVIQEAYELSYNPLLTSIENSPGTKVHLHFTGPLLEWLEANEPQFLERVVKLYKEGQVAIVGGGYYEPILSMIPEETRIKQVHKLRDWWKTKFDIDVNGAWLAERVWEPSLAKSLHDAGVDYIFIDDLFIKSGGFSEYETFYSYYTEDQGKGVKVIPINEPIRYLIPWKSVGQTLEYMKKGVHPNNETLILVMSDAEKMGLWPAGKRTTYDICYGDGWPEDGDAWMDVFLGSVAEEDFIISTHIKPYLEKNDTRSLIYIPSASYDKMGVWALPTPGRRRIEALQKAAKEMDNKLTPDILNFSKGSFWRNFVVKYPEVNNMHKRALLSFQRVQAVKDKIPLELYEEAMDRIMSAQSNDPYWHGMFGGAYYRFMRASVFYHAIKAESLINDFQDNRKPIEVFDFTVNGRNEVTMQTSTMRAYITPFDGGTMFQLEDLKAAMNWLNVFSRREEAYHKVSLDTDRYPRRSFRDHFIADDIKFERYTKDTFKRIGNFADAIYSYEVEVNAVVLKYTGTIVHHQKEYVVNITKTYRIVGSELHVHYVIVSDNEIPGVNFVPEMNVTLNSHPHMTSFAIKHQKISESTEYIDKKFEMDQVQSFRLRDDFEKSQMKISFSNPVHMKSYPVFTESYTDRGTEHQYQTSCFLPLIPFKKELEFTIMITVEYTEEPKKVIDL